MSNINQLNPKNQYCVWETVAQKDASIIKLSLEIENINPQKNNEIQDINAAAELICSQDYTNLLGKIDNLNGKAVILEVNGPFSNLLSVTGSNYLFRQLKKAERAVTNALEIINTSTAALIIKAVKHGVNIISYADSSAMPMVIGEKFFYEYSVKSSFSLMQMVRNDLSESIMHICPQTSFSLERYKLCRFEKTECINKNLHENLLYLSRNKDLVFTGHICINSVKHPGELYIIKKQK